jgi:hypothetical protein
MIEEIVDSYSGKYDHFMLRGKNMDLHLKCDVMEEKKKWIDGINYMREYYKHDKSSVILLKELDDEIRLMILAENDLRFWNKIMVIILTSGKTGLLTIHRRQVSG